MVTFQQHIGHARDPAPSRRVIVQLRGSRDDPFAELHRGLRHPGVVRGIARGDEQLQLLGRLGGDRQRADEIAVGAPRRAELERPLRRAAKRNPRLRGDGRAFGTAGMRLVRVDVVLRQDARQLLVAERLVVARRRQVPCSPVVAGQGGVGDLAQQPLDEPILAPLRRARIVVPHQDLAAAEVVQHSVDVVGIRAGDGAERGRAERESQHRCVLHERALRRRKAIDPRGDERMERFRHGELAEIADGAEGVAVALDAAVIQQRAHRLDRIQRDALRAPDDPVDDAVRQTGHEPAHHRSHLVVVERGEREGGEAALAGTPRRPAVEELRARQRDDVDRSAARPGQQVLDEVEETLIGPLEILEDHDHRAGLGDALEEGAPCAEELPAFARPALADAQEMQQRTLQAPTFVRIGHELIQAGGEPRARARLIGSFADADPHADHLAKRPEADALAIGG